MKSKKNILLIIACIVLMVASFNFNIFVSREEKIGTIPFKSFQADSELLVLGRIYQDHFHSNKSSYGLVGVLSDTNENITKVLTESLNTGTNRNDLLYEDYKSSYGLQGHIFSFIYNKLHIPINIIKIINCLLLSITLTMISFIISKKYSKSLGIIFYLTFLVSPWIIAFARNLFWVEFTWFLPALFALILSLDYSKKKIYVPLIFISILIKCLCGYEYITCIMMFTVVFYIVDFFKTKEKKEKKEIFKTTLIVSIVCLFGFLLAFLIHANLRGNGNILEGAKTIYEQDVVRRTLNIPGSEKFNSSVYSTSINSSVIKTIVKYFNWNSNIILGIDGIYFRIIVFVSAISLIYGVIKHNKNAMRNLVMFIAFLMTTLSWFVLAKAHSYIHTHMNYVLWYFGFVQICLYTIFCLFCKLIKHITKNKIEEV